MPDMLVHAQHQQQLQHVQMVPRSYPYPLTHSQSHSLFKCPSSSSPLLQPLSPSSVQVMLRRYSPLLLHLQLNEHQKRKKEKRERRQERRNEKKRLQEQELAMRMRLEAEQSTAMTATDESLVAQQMRQIEQTQQSQRITTPTTRGQQSLGAALASPQYTASLMMTLEKLSGAQQQEQATTQQQSQPQAQPQQANPSLPPRHRSPTSASPVTSQSPLAPPTPSALPVSPSPLPTSSSSSLSPIVPTSVVPSSTSTSTSAHPSHPRFRPVMTTDLCTSSPSQRTRELLAQQPRDDKSPSLTTRFLLSKHLSHSLSADCVELMSCSIEDIPSSCDDSLTCDEDSSLYTDFSRICISHDEYDTRETFHIPHATEYVSFGPQIV